MMTFTATPLAGRFVRLEPLADDLRTDLRRAIGGQDPIWDIMASNASGDRFDPWWAQALDDIRSRRRVGFAVRLQADGEVVGTTSFLHVDPANRGVEIGSTFLNATARAGPANPDMKLAMLRYAFDQGAVRVELRTDGRNLRSQAAIAKLGAVREGVLRKQKILWNGEARETVVFSVIDEEWPTVQARLEARLDAFAGSQGAAG